jgi:acyl carrier protein
MERTVARELLARALGLSVSEMPEQPLLDTTNEWDSLAHMRLVMELERELDRQLSADEILFLDSLDAVEKVLHGSHSP